MNKYEAILDDGTTEIIEAKSFGEAMEKYNPDRHRMIVALRYLPNKIPPNVIGVAGDS